MATPMTQEIRRVPADAAGEPAGVCSDPSQSRANRVLAGLPRADLALLAEHVQIVSQRLSRWLLERADRLESDSIVIPVSPAELSEQLGIRRTTVTVLAGKLQDVDAIRWRRSRVEIVDRTPLEATACSCYAALRGRMNDPRAAASAEPRSSLGGEPTNTLF